MSSLLAFLIVINLLVSAVLCVLWQRSRRVQTALRAEIDALQQASHAIPADLDELLGNHNCRVISIEILNPVELATARTLLAKPLVSVSPGTISRLVYKEAREIIAKQLPEYGVNAEVRVYGA